jgi:transcriptional regulator with XRE-family HTH domain
MESAATRTRNFSRFLLMAQLQAKEIGARIALARNEAGLTQEEVTDLATFSKRSLQDYERGNTIPYRHMQEISRLLDRPVEWFLHGERPADASETPVELRLAELAAAVEAMSRQLEDGSRLVAHRLEQLERRLQETSASATPRGAGRRATGTRK